jgi:hypothetical protein
MLHTEQRLMRRTRQPKSRRARLLTPSHVAVPAADADENSRLQSSAVELFPEEKWPQSTRTMVDSGELTTHRIWVFMRHGALQWTD